MVKTIAAISAPRNRQSPAEPRAPLTAEEKKEKREATKETQEKIDEEVGNWFAATQAKAIELGLRFDKKPRYFLDIFFQGGAHMVNHQEKVNAYNAFKWDKANQLREEGTKGKAAPALHDGYHEEYNALTEEEKLNLVERFTEAKADLPKIRRDTPRARIRDLSNTVRNIQMMLHGVSYRVGAEAMLCIVRNTPDFYMAPQWYFTSPELERYMPLAVRRHWDTGEVGTRLEAFALAGLDTMNLLRMGKQKIDFLRGEIRDYVLRGLVKITEKSDIRMDYKFYEESIVVKYGVDLQGWTAERFVSPSELSSSLAVLTTLRDALKDGKCEWVKLGKAAHKARITKWKADVASGEVVARSRATCSDCGKKRDATTMEEDDPDEGESPGNEDGINRTLTTSTTPIIEEPDESATLAAVSQAGSAPKRRKTTASTAASTTGPKKSAAKKTRAKAVPALDEANKENTRRDGRRKRGERDDDVTRAAIAKVKSRPGPKSRTIISDDEDADETPAATPAHSLPAVFVPIDPALVDAAA
ncbi:hypothetical protein DFH09DRAFT_1339785 [Mycena vulgaris]|nr:hypothetical protein DFH09DRAFT_1339785 [Mycena vulgaris]